MPILKQSTEVKVVIGPVVSVSDGFTPVTTLSLSTADEAEIIKHDASAVTDISGATMVAITSADGYYNLTLTTSLTDTVGMLTVLINDDSLCLPVKHTFQVVEEVIYDSLFAASAAAFDANQRVDVAALAGNSAAVTNMVNFWSALITGTAQGGGASTITLAAGASSTTGFYDDMVINLVGGKGAGQTRKIDSATTYNGTTKVATVTEAWAIEPDATSVYQILGRIEP